MLRSATCVGFADFELIGSEVTDSYIYYR